MVTTILSHPFFLDLLLPAILVFTVIFALLQKSEIFGKGKVQIDAIVSLVVALIVISFGKAMGIIANLMPVLAVTVVALLVFIIIASIAHTGKFELPGGVKTAVMVVAAIVVLIAVLYFTGGWDYLKEILQGKSSTTVTTILFAIIIAAAIFVVIKFGAKASESKS